MINIIYGDDNYNINKYTKGLSENKEIVTFDVMIDPVMNIYKEMATIDLFQTEKVYVLKNIDLFEVKKSKLNKKNLKIMDMIFDLDNDLIIINNKKINKKTLYYEKYFTKIKYKEFLQEQVNLNSELKKYLEQNEIKINNEAQKLLLSYHQELYALINDIDKLWQYADQKEICLSDIENVGINYITYQIFQLYEYILSGKKVKAQEYLDTLVQQGNDLSTIFLIYLTQIAKFYSVKVLMQENSSDMWIGKELAMSPYQVKHIKRNLQNISLKKIEKEVQNLAQYDYYFKSGQMKIENIFNLILNEVA